MKKISEEVKWGIIGCGDVCEVKSGPAFNKVEHSSLKAVMRRDAALAEDFAKRHQVPLYFSDAEELIHCDEVNAIYIATPPSFHETYVTKALKAGKPVYVEKPVSLSTASVERMISEQQASGVPVSIAHYRRELPLFQKVKDLVHSNAIGKPQLTLIRTLQPPMSTLVTQTKDQWRLNPSISGGGLFHDLSPHQLDILYWIFGEADVKHASSINLRSAYDAPDTVSLELLFLNDMLFQGVWSFSMPSSYAEDSCTIIGDRGTIQFSFFTQAGRKLWLKTEEGEQSLAFDVPENIQLHMIRQVVEYFRGNRDNPCSLEEAQATMKIMDATIAPLVS